MNLSDEGLPADLDEYCSWAEEITSTNDSVNLSMQQPNLIPFYGDKLKIYNEYYSSKHGYISLILCIFGITANFMNIIVLRKKNMISPTNVILTGLAVADMMVMISYIFFGFHFFIDIGLENTDTFGWIAFEVFHAHFTNVIHNVSLWLGVTVAIWRLMAVHYPAETIEWRSLFRARIAIVLIYIASIIVFIPQYLALRVCKSFERGDMYYLGLTDIHLANISFWIWGVISKIVPCVALTGLSLCLIRVLHETKLRKKRLNTKFKCDESHNRTTKMLLVICLLIILTEFPSGILILLCGFYGDDFYTHVFLNLTETMDALYLINSAVNFIIYCSMSREFRDTFALLFLTKFRKVKWAGIFSSKPKESLGTACV